MPKLRKRLSLRVKYRVAMSPAYDARPHGAEALGVSLPKRARWRALGGHGRNGAG